jgi:hypothetical protein
VCVCVCVCVCACVCMCVHVCVCVCVCVWQHVFSPGKQVRKAKAHPCPSMFCRTLETVCAHAVQVSTGLPLPPAPFLFGLIMRGEEIEWAQVFPSRLLLLCVRAARVMLLACSSVLWTSLFSLNNARCIVGDTLRSFIAWFEFLPHLSTSKSQCLLSLPRSFLPLFLPHSSHTLFLHVTHRHAGWATCIPRTRPFLCGQTGFGQL